MMMEEEKKIRLLANWCDSNEIKRVWSKQLKDGRTWNSLILDQETQNPDYYVIINQPRENETYEASKTIVVQMEPSSIRKMMFAPKWQEPDPSEFLEVYSISRFRMTLEWHLSSTYQELKTTEVKKTKVLSSCTSAQVLLPGHQLRVKFLHSLDAAFPNFELWGRHPHPLKSYKGSLPAYTKDEALFPFKYTFSAENCQEKNYFTEKIIDAVLAETLCFYWGCPNLEEFIDPACFIRINLEKPEESVSIIKKAIENEEWEKRIDIIRKEKIKILDNLQVFPTLEGIINKKRKQAEFLNSNLKAFCINLDRSKDRWQRSVKEFQRIGLEVERFSAVDGKLVDKQQVIKQGLLSPNFIEMDKPGAIGCLLSHIGIWKLAVERKTPWTLILEDDCRFHPAFSDVFETYWKSVLFDAEFVYFSISYLLNEGLGDVGFIRKGTPVNDYVIRNRVVMTGAHAYAVTCECAEKLLKLYLPAVRPVDYFEPSKIKIYSFRDVNDKKWGCTTPKDFYIDNTTWEGHSAIQVHGLISVRNESTTIGHAGPYYFKAGIAKRMRGDFRGCYNDLMEARKIGNLNQDVENFEFWDELISCCFYLQDFKTAIQAGREIINRNQTIEGLERIKKEGGRVFRNLKFYSDKAVISDYVTQFSFLKLYPQSPEISLVLEFLESKVKEKGYVNCLQLGALPPPPSPLASAAKLPSGGEELKEIQSLLEYFVKFYDGKLDLSFNESRNSPDLVYVTNQEKYQEYLTVKTQLKDSYLLLLNLNVVTAWDPSYEPKLFLTSSAFNGYMIPSYIETVKVVLSSTFNCFCLNSDEAKDNWDKSVQEFKSLGLEITQVKIDRKDNWLAKNSKAWSSGKESTTSSKTWILICDDNFRVHPSFLSNFEKYWNTVPKTADIVYFGYNSASSKGESVNDYLLKLNTELTLSEPYAYAITLEAISRLEGFLAIETYAFRSLPSDLRSLSGDLRLLPQGSDEFYTDIISWQAPRKLAGLIGIRNEVNLTTHPGIYLFNRGRDKRRRGDHNGAFEDLQEAKVFGKLGDDITYFDLPDELVTCSFYLSKLETGISEFNYLLKNNNTSEGRKRLLAHSSRLFKNLKFYNNSSLTTLFLDKMRFPREEYEPEYKALIKFIQEVILKKGEIRIFNTSPDSKDYRKIYDRFISLYDGKIETVTSEVQNCQVIHANSMKEFFLIKRNLKISEYDPIFLVINQVDPSFSELLGVVKKPLPLVVNISCIQGSENSQVLMELLKAPDVITQLLDSENKVKFADMSFSLNTVYPEHIDTAPINFLITNHPIPANFQPFLTYYDVVLSSNLKSVEWTTVDDYQPEIEKIWNVFMEVEDTDKKMLTVIETWKNFEDLPPLSISKAIGEDLKNLPPKVITIEDSVKKVQNSCGIHICLTPKALFHSNSVGAVVINLTESDLTTENLQLAVNKVLKLSLEEKKILGSNARLEYLKKKHEFVAKFDKWWIPLKEKKVTETKLKSWFVAVPNGIDSLKQVKKFRENSEHQKASDLLKLINPDKLFDEEARNLIFWEEITISCWYTGEFMHGYQAFTEILRRNSSNPVGITRLKTVKGRFIANLKFYRGKVDGAESLLQKWEAI